jgi:cyclophilin family peptidyl-prolyl cis-trans isomerase
MRNFTLAAGAMMILFTTAVPAQNAAKPSADPHPVVIMKTNQGTMEIMLDAEKAPVTVKNFLSYVNEAFYDSTIFHRVISGFMIQGGGFVLPLSQKATRAPIKNEAANGLKNKRGTIAMARTGEVNSATCQFFINHADNAFLDYKNDTPQGFGYAVFGQVTKGIEVVDKIASIPTSPQDMPMQPVVILSLRVKK